MGEWQDVFVTSSVNNTYQGSRFVCPVMSVDVGTIQPDINFGKTVDQQNAVVISPATAPTFDDVSKYVSDTNATTSYTAATPCEASVWLLPGFPADRDQGDIANWTSLKVGDALRIGSDAHGGQTRYVKVMETKQCDLLINAHLTEVDFEIASTMPGQTAFTSDNKYRGHERVQDSSVNANVHDLYYKNYDAVLSNTSRNWSTLRRAVTLYGHSGSSYNNTLIGTEINPLALGNNYQNHALYQDDERDIDGQIRTRAKYAYAGTPPERTAPNVDGQQPRETGHNLARSLGLAIRVNAIIDATTLPTKKVASSEFGIPTETFADLSKRGQISVKSGREGLYYPCYKINGVVAESDGIGQLVTNLPGRTCSAIKLMEVTVAELVKEGTGEDNTSNESDWIAVTVDEIDVEGVISDNSAANGALFVVQANADISTVVSNNVTFHRFDANGLGCANFPPKKLQRLSIKLQSNDSSLSIGQVHLWFKVYTPTCT